MVLHSDQAVQQTRRPPSELGRSSALDDTAGSDNDEEDEQEMYDEEEEMVFEH